MSTPVETPMQALYRNFNKMAMYTPTPGVEGRRAQLIWGLRDGNPRITVWTNHPEDNGGKGQIYAGFTADVFMAFLTLFKKVIHSPTEMKVKFDNYIAKFENDQRTNERTLGSELWVGKDGDGMVWISLISSGRPKVVFKFTMNDWHNIFINGEQINQSQASVLQAGIVAETLERVYSNIFAMEFDKLTQRQIDAKAKRSGGGFSKPAAAPLAQQKTAFDSSVEFEDIRF